METFFMILGIVQSIFWLVAIITAVVLTFRGILPVLIRLGYGLATRKIVIIAKNDNMESLKNLLTDSGLFRKENISAITTSGDIGRMDGATVYLMHWHDFSADVETILAQKPDKCPLVVYAPYNLGRIPDDQMANLDGKRHTAVTNFRGRLLNDIVTGMITTNL